MTRGRTRVLDRGGARRALAMDAGRSYRNVSKMMPTGRPRPSVMASYATSDSEGPRRSGREGYALGMGQTLGHSLSGRRHREPGGQEGGGVTGVARPREMGPVEDALLDLYGGRQQYRGRGCSSSISSSFGGLPHVDPSVRTRPGAGRFAASLAAVFDNPDLVFLVVGIGEAETATARHGADCNKSFLGSGHRTARCEERRSCISTATSVQPDRLRIIRTDGNHVRAAT